MVTLYQIIQNFDRKSIEYSSGQNDFHAGVSITDCPIYGTTWDQTNWMAGWLDALAKKVRET